MKNSSFIVSSTQHAFIVAVRPYLAQHGITDAKTGGLIPFAAFTLAAKSAGYSAVPAWCMTADRKSGRGVYRIEELFATDSQFTINEVKRGRPAGSKNLGKTAKTVKSVKSIKSTIKEITAKTPTLAPVVPSCTAVAMTTGISTAELARAMSHGESETFTPAADPNYIAWGYHNEIKKVIKSKSFCPVFITGMSGNGKTTMVEQICADLDRECVRVNFTAATDEDELLGGFRLIAGETKFVPGPVLVAMERGAVLLLDEVDLGGHLIMCLQSVLEGKGKFIPKIGKYVRPAKGFTIVATANTKGKGSDDGRFIGTNVMNEAFLDRFDYTYEQEYAPKSTEKKIITKAMKKYGIDEPDFVTNLVDWADITRQSFMNNAVSEIISTRRLLTIVKAYSVFKDKVKAVKMSLARFDKSTQDALYSLYTKVDGTINPPPAHAEQPKAADPFEPPF